MKLTATAEDLEAGIVDVNGVIDSRGIRYIGKARRQPDGTWRSLADVGGSLCICEVSITLPSEYDA